MDAGELHRARDARRTAALERHAARAVVQRDRAHAAPGDGAHEELHAALLRRACRQLPRDFLYGREARAPCQRCRPRVPHPAFHRH